MRTVNEIILTAGDMSGNLTSSEQDVTGLDTGSIQAVFTGSPVGVLKLQTSNDGTAYSDYTGSCVSVTAAGNFMWNLETMGYKFIQLVYTATSGSGSLKAVFNGKGE